MAEPYATLFQTCYINCSQGPSPYTVTPPDFAALFPEAIDYAEGRIYRDIPMLAQRTQDTSLTTTAGSRTLTLTGTALPLLTAEGIALIVPSGTSSPAAGTRVPYDVASLDVIDLIWPQESVTMAPAAAEWLGRYWAMRDDHTAVIAPTPDAAYTVETTGLFQQTPLSASNTSTYLSTTYPSLMTTALMIFLSGALKKNFGAQADDPKMALSWEGQYRALMMSAKDEEMRRRGLTPDAPHEAPEQ